MLITAILLILICLILVYQMIFLQIYLKRVTLAQVAVRLRRLFPHQAERSIIVYLTLENDD